MPPILIIILFMYQVHAVIVATRTDHTEQRLIVMLHVMAIRLKHAVEDVLIQSIQ